MEKKQKLALIILILILLALPVALYLSKQRQEIRKKAAGCTITLDTANTNVHSPGTWQLLSNGSYKILKSNLKIAINWHCESPVSSFEIYTKDNNWNGIIFLNDLCKVNGISQCPSNNYQCNLSTPSTAGSLICDIGGLRSRYQLVDIFDPVYNPYRITLLFFP